MRDANEYYLNQYMTELSKSDKRDEWIESQIEFLTSEGQDYWPWSSDNMNEALENMTEMDNLTYLAFIRSCSKLQGNEFIRASMAEHVIHVITKYWTELAMIKADIDFSEFED